MFWWVIIILLLIIILLRNSFFSHSCVIKWNSLLGRVVEASTVMTVNNFKNLYDSCQARYVMNEESSVWTA